MLAYCNKREREMLEFTFEQVKAFFIISIVISIFYMIIYHLKGHKRGIAGYIQAIQHCITYGVIAIFEIVAIGLVREVIEQGVYVALIIPLGWLIIIYFVLKKCLNTDFNLNIHILNCDPVKQQKMKIIIILSILSLGFAITTLMTFFVALPDVKNQPYGPVPIFIAGIIFALATILFIRILYSKIVEIRKESKSNKID